MLGTVAFNPKHHSASRSRYLASEAAVWRPQNCCGSGNTCLALENVVFDPKQCSSSGSSYLASAAAVWHCHCVVAVTALLGLLLAVSSRAFVSMSVHSNWSGAPACFCDGWRSKVLFEDAVSVHTLRGTTELRSTSLSAWICTGSH